MKDAHIADGATIVGKRDVQVNARESRFTRRVENCAGHVIFRYRRDSWDGMVRLMATHIAENHLVVAKKMERMHKKDPTK